MRNQECHFSWTDSFAFNAVKSIAAAALAALLLSGCVSGNNHAGQKAAAREVAYIEFDFEGSPLEQCLSFYAFCAKEKLRAPDYMSSGGSIRGATSHRVTRSEALKLLDAILLEQAQITITRAADGTLEAIPKQKMEGPPAVRNAMRTYLPDGNVDPPFPEFGGPKLQPRLSGATNMQPP
jgi:hypothetical protein